MLQIGETIIWHFNQHPNYNILLALPFGQISRGHCCNSGSRPPWLRQNGRGIPISAQVREHRPHECIWRLNMNIISFQRAMLPSEDTILNIGSYLGVRGKGIGGPCSWRYYRVKHFIINELFHKDLRILKWSNGRVRGPWRPFYNTVLGVHRAKKFKNHWSRNLARIL